MNTGGVPAKAANLRADTHHVPEMFHILNELSACFWRVGPAV